MKICIFGKHVIITVNPHLVGTHKNKQRYWLCDHHYQMCSVDTLDKLKQYIQDKELEWFIESNNWGGIGI